MMRKLIYCILAAWWIPSLSAKPLPFTLNFLQRTRTLTSPYKRIEVGARSLDILRNTRGGAVSEAQMRMRFMRRRISPLKSLKMLRTMLGVFWSSLFDPRYGSETAPEKGVVALKGRDHNGKKKVVKVHTLADLPQSRG